MQRGGCGGRGRGATAVGEGADGARGADVPLHGGGGASAPHVGRSSTSRAPGRAISGGGGLYPTTPPRADACLVAEEESRRPLSMITSTADGTLNGDFSEMASRPGQAFFQRK